MPSWNERFVAGSAEDLTGGERKFSCNANLCLSVQEEDIGHMMYNENGLTGACFIMSAENH